MKICTGCKESKPFEDFGVLRKTKDQRAYRCKACEALRRAARKDKKAAYDRKYHLANRKKKCEITRLWAEANADRRREWQEANRDRILRREKAYRETHLAERAEWESRRRARKLEVACEDISRAFLLERDAGFCGICDQPVDPENWHMDHRLPLARGGDHTYANVQVTHPECNMEKGARWS